MAKNLIFEQHLPKVKLSDVGSTSLLTLYCHAIESQSPNPILKDPEAEKIASRLDPVLEQSQDQLLRSLAQRKLRSQLVVHIALRAAKYDEYARQFLYQNPKAAIVDIGCGMDTRFFRVDNGEMQYFDLDLPEIIDVKCQLLQESDRYHMLARSVFDYDWMAEVKKHGDRPVMFLAEGVFMYLEPDHVKDLVIELQKQFPGSELICEVFNSLWLRNPLKAMSKMKMQRQLNLGAGAEFQFGIAGSKDMEGWCDGIEFLDDWSYFQSDNEKLGWMRLMRHIGFMNKVQWTVHYRLNPPRKQSA